MSAPKKIRFGVLGASRIAHKAALPAIMDSPLAELVMVGSRSRQRGEECARLYGSVFGSYEDVLESKDVDAVYISLPNSLHEEWAIRAARAGKHVWCEKPAALSYTSAKVMVAAAKANSVRLMEGFMFLYHPQHAKVMELIKAGTLGEIGSFEGEYTFPMPEEGDIRRQSDLGGGILNDAGVYPIRASRYVFAQEPTSVECSTTLDAATQVDVKAQILLNYPGGKTARCFAAFDSDYRSTYSVLGVTARLSLERAYAVQKDKAVKIFLDENGVRTEILIGPADHFRLMLEEFCREIPSGEKSTRQYEDDLLAQARALDASRRSAAEGRAVMISEIV